MLLSRDIFLLIFLPLTLCAGADLRNQAPYTGAVDLSADTSRAGLVRVPLSKDWLQRSGPNQRALRLIDDTGAVVPFVIAQQSGQPATPREVTMEIVDYTRDRQGERLILLRENNDLPISALRVETPSRTFYREVIVEKSGDGETWEPLTQGPIFDLTPRFDFRRTRLSFEPSTARWIRLHMLPPLRAAESVDFIEMRVGDLTIAARDLPPGASFRIDELVGESPVEAGIPPVWDRFTVDQPPPAPTSRSETVFDLGCPGLPVERIKIATTQSLLDRKIRLESRERPDGPFASVWRDRISRSPDDVRAPLFLTGPPRHLTCARLVVEDADNPALPVSAVHLDWHRRELIFHADPSRQYTLLAGAAGWTRPRFELASLVSTRPADLPHYAPATVAAPAPNPTWVSPESPLRNWWERTVPAAFGVLLVLMTIFLGYWIWRILAWQS
ncbi:MAG: hypothetical protein JJT96_04965 [Opitutales bacterium]|nr:hypothetical protein [Opitutales bacterium]